MKIFRGNTMNTLLKMNLNDNVQQKLVEDKIENLSALEMQLAKIKRLNLRIGFVDASLSEHLEQKRRYAKEIEIELENKRLTNNQRQKKFNSMRVSQVNTSLLIEKITLLTEELAAEENILENLFATQEV